MYKLIFIISSIFILACATPRMETYKQSVEIQQQLWEQHKKERMIFQLDPGDECKDGYLTYDKNEETWLYNRPNQRPLMWWNGRWILSE